MAQAQHEPSVPRRSPPSRSRRRQLAPKVCLLAGGIAAGLLISELALRAALPLLPGGMLSYLHPALKQSHPAVRTKLRRLTPYFNLRAEHPETGWTFAPGLRLRGTNEDGQPYEAAISPEGFFTPDRPAPSEKQLIVLGDSFLSTFYVPRPIASVLADEAGLPLYNLAVHAWGPESYRAAYRRFARGRNHQRVVVFSFVNDITDVDNWLRWQASGSSEGFLAWLAQTFPDPQVENTGQTWLDRRSVVWNCLKRSTRTTAPWWEIRDGQATRALPTNAVGGLSEAFAVGGAPGFELRLVPGHSFTVLDPDQFFPGGDYFPYVRAYLDSLERLRADVAAQGARMVLVWIPSKERVYLPLLSPERRGRFVANSSGRIDGLERVLAQYAREVGLDLLDLTEPLAARAARGEKLYFTDDGHLNDAGNVAVGQLAARFLAALPEDAPPPLAREQRVLLAEPQVDVARPLALEALEYTAAIARRDAGGWRIEGVGESAYSYLAKWAPTAAAESETLIVKGTLRHGGLTVGLQADEAWQVQQSVTRPGPFCLVLPVRRAGSYSVVMANNLADQERRIDVRIEAIGFGPPAPQPAAAVARRNPSP